MIKRVSGWVSSLLDLLYPAFCSSCEEPLKVIRGPGICPGCLDKLDLIGPPYCPLCGLPYTEPVRGKQAEHLCTDCGQSDRPFKRMRSALLYESPAKELIHNFKYRGNFKAGGILSRLMARLYFGEAELHGCSMIIHIPLHPKRKRERGFDQSALLAAGLARETGVPFRKILERTKYTAPQTSLPAGSRKTNVKGVFSISGRSSPEGEAVLVVDDVYTTGATMEECAKVLMKKGAEVVKALTAARVPL